MQALSTTETQYLGTGNFWSRIIDFSLWQLNSVFEQFLKIDENGMLSGYNEKNPLIAIMKNFLFGEYINESIFTFGTVAEKIAVIFFWVSVVLAILAFAAMIAICFLHTQMNKIEKIFLITLYGCFMVSLYSLSATMPFVCSMNSRYITPTISIMTLCLGICIQRLQMCRKRLATIAVTITGILTIGFAFLTTLVYLYVLTQ